MDSNKVFSNNHQEPSFNSKQGANESDVDNIPQHDITLRPEYNKTPELTVSPKPIIRKSTRETKIPKHFVDFVLEH